MHWVETSSCKSANEQTHYSNSSLGSKLQYRYHSRLPWAPSLICCWTFHLGWNSWILLWMLVSTYLRVIVVIMVKLRMDSYDAAESSSDWHSHIIMWIKFSDHKQLIFATSFPVIFNGSFHFLKPYVSEQISSWYLVCLNSNWALVVEISSFEWDVNLIPWMRYNMAWKGQTLMKFECFDGIVQTWLSIWIRSPFLETVAIIFGSQ